MTRFARVLIILLIVGVGFIIYLIVRTSRERIPVLPTEVSADSIMAYEARADSLSVGADTLEDVLGRAGLLEQPGIRRRLARLNEEIDALRTAVERWRAARDSNGQGQAYRECILLYGRASGVCDALRIDTAPPPPPKRLGR